MNDAKGRTVQRWISLALVAIGIVLVVLILQSIVPSEVGLVFLVGVVVWAVILVAADRRRKTTPPALSGRDAGPPTS